MNGYNRYQLNRIDMVGTVASYLREHQNTWEAVGDIATTVQVLNEKLVSVQDKLQRQQAIALGSTEDKELVGRNLQDSLVELAHQTAALGHRLQDVKLAALCKVTPSGLKRMPAEALENKARQVVQQARVHLGSLAGSGITATDLDAFEALIIKFRDAKNAPRQALANRAAETRTLPGQLREIVDLLQNRLDKQIARFRRSHPEFVTGYHRARVVVDRGGRSAAEPQGPAAALPAAAPITPPPAKAA